MVADAALNPDSVKPRRVTPPSLIEAIYNARQPRGWRWEHLTSGEQAVARRDIVGVLDAVPEGWMSTDSGWIKPR